MEFKDFKFVTSSVERSNECRCEQTKSAVQIGLRLDDQQI